MAFRWTRGGSWVLDEASLEDTPCARMSAPREPYVLAHFYQLDRILDAYVAFWRRNSELARAVRLVRGEEVLPLHPLLLALIEEHGPLWAPYHDPLGGPRIPMYTMQVINLDEFAHASQHLATAWQALGTLLTPRQRARLQDDLLLGAGIAVLQSDMRLIPGFRNSRFVYDVSPRSLHALLWERVFRVFGRATRVVCRYCGDAFEPEPARGRTPEYCPAHRGSRFRQAVLEGRAPIQRFSGRFNLKRQGSIDD